MIRAPIEAPLVGGENRSETTEGTWRGAIQDAAAQTNPWAQRCRGRLRTEKRMVGEFPATGFMIFGTRDRDAGRR